MKKLALLFSTVLAGCGSTVSGTSDSGHPSDASHPSACAPGEQIGCVCTTGAHGAQACNAAGTGYGACQCSGTKEGGRADATPDAPRKQGDSGKDATGDTTTSEDGEHEAGVKDGGMCTPPKAPADAATPGTLNWAENFGNTGAIEGPVVAIDPTNGDIVVAGGLAGSVNFGGGLETTHGGGDAADPPYDTFVARFDASGHYKWSKDFGNGLIVGANSVAVDSSGNVAVAGVFQGSVSFGGPTLTAVGNTDVFVVEFDSSGTFVWSKSFGTAEQYEGVDTVATDSTDDVLITGESTSLNFGGSDLTGFYIAKFSSAGAYSWSKAIAAQATTSSPTIAVDRSGSVVLAGSFSGMSDFGGGPLTAPGGGECAFVAKYNSSGSYEWANAYPSVVPSGTPGSAVSNGGVAVDECGNIFVTGNFFGSIDFMAGNLLTGSDPTKEYVFLVKLDPLGGGTWAKSFTAELDDLNGGQLAADGLGGVTFAAALGTYNAGGVDFGGGALSATGSASVVAASFDPSGAYRWSYSGGSPSTAAESGATGVAASATGAVVVGSFGTCPGDMSCTTSPVGTTLVLAGKTLDAQSTGDLFVASFVP